MILKTNNLNLKKLYLNEQTGLIDGVVPKFLSNYKQVSSEEGTSDLQSIVGPTQYGMVSPNNGNKRTWLFGDIDISKLKTIHGTDKTYAANLAKELENEIKSGNIDPIFVEINADWDDEEMIYITNREIIDGNHRVVAAKMLGIKTLPGYVIMPVEWSATKELNEGINYVKIFRAFPLSASTIRKGDYVTLSKKFASDHAVTSAIYNDEPFQVAMKLIPSEHIKPADNPGEFIYTGPDISVKPLLVADTDGEIKRHKMLEEESDDEPDKCKDPIKPPFIVYHDFLNHDILVFKGLDPRYNEGKIKTINLNDPSLYATQDHVCKTTIEKYSKIKSKKMPIVVEFDNGMKFIQDGHHQLSALKMSGVDKSKAYVISREDSVDVLSEERIKKNKYGADLFQMGGSLPDELYNKKDGKPSRDPGVGPGGKSEDTSEDLEKERDKKKRWYSLKEYFFNEAAVGPDQLPKGSKISIEKGMFSGFSVTLTDPEDKKIGEVEVGEPKSGEKCDNAYIIAHSRAEKGFGPLLYDVALEYAGNRGITADRHNVSSDASKVWEYYFNNRPDVEKKPLDPETCSFEASKFAIPISFSPDEEGKIKRPWLNYVYYLPGQKNMKKLKDMGVLDLTALNEANTVSGINLSTEIPEKHWDSHVAKRVNKDAKANNQKFVEKLYLQTLVSIGNTDVAISKLDPDFERNAAIVKKQKNIPKPKTFHKQSGKIEYVDTDPRSNMPIYVTTNDANLERSKKIAKAAIKRMNLKDIYFITKK